MKKRWLVVVALAAVLSIALTACTKKEEEEMAQEVVDAIEEEVDEVSGESDDAGGDTVDMSSATVKEWGAFTVSVPTGFEFQGGDVLDEEDKECFSVKESSFKYFDFNRQDKENGMAHYKNNKETYTNGQTDVSGTIGDFSWTGFQYEDGFGGYGFELYTEVGDKVVRVSSAGYTFDSAVTEGILGSLHVK